MITLISLAGMQNPDYTKTIDKTTVKTQISNDIINDKVKPTLDNYKAYNLVSFKGYSSEFKLPASNPTNFKTFDEVVTYYTPYMQSVIKDFNKRKNQDGQFLKWASLPQAQLDKKENGKSHLDEIYSQVATLSARKNANGTERPLVVLGIGGSKHTVEFLLNMNGVGNKGKIYFYSDIDPVSFNNFLKETGKTVSEMNYLVASKSGTTFETADAFKRFENAVIEEYKKSGLPEEEAQKKAQEHFAICTDAKATEKNLRGKIGSKNGENNGYIKELYIHDDVGGRFSMFDDAGLFALAYSNVPKSIAERILISAAKTSEKMSDETNIQDNVAAKSAIFNVFSRDNKFNIIQQQYFGRIFQGGGENWAKQLYLESIKDFDYTIGCAPESMHYATEGHFSPNNRTSYNTIMTIMNPDISQNYKTYTSAIAATYNETTPLKIETLDVENDAIQPETIGEYIQTKHFETAYMGMLRRAAKQKGMFKQFFTRENQPANTAIPEVLQPSVETYKNKFKQGEYKLNPGN